MISFLKEQVYLITGASSGIGAATALKLNSLGATVIANARREDKLISIKNQAAFPENFHIAVKDVAVDLASLSDWVKELKNTHGKFSGFFHAAGYNIMAPFSNFDLEECRKLFDVHYYAAMLLAKAITDRRNNVGKGTSLVFISSICAVVPLRMLSMYASAKGALVAGARTLAKEVGERGIRVNCISPALVRTELTEEYSNAIMGYDILKIEDDIYPLGISSPEDIANMIIFLFSDKSAKITCQNIPIDGGKF